VISWFMSLTIGGKLIAIGFQLLGVILLIAWAVFITKRLGSMPAVTLSQDAENRKKSTARQYKNSTHQKRKNQVGICRLLGSCHHIIKDNGVRYPTDNCGDQCKQPAQRVEPKNFGFIRVILLFPISHIRNIVAKLIARCQLKWRRTLSRVLFHYRLRLLPSNEFYAGGGKASRRYFRGARRRKLC
jgi:hypothetical protein